MYTLKLTGPNGDTHIKGTKLTLKAARTLWSRVNTVDKTYTGLDDHGQRQTFTWSKWELLKNGQPFKKGNF